MRIPAVIEWKGGSIGWWGAARLRNGIEVKITSGHSPTAIRRRVIKALIKEGVEEPELVEDLRIPKALVEEVEALRKMRERVDLATGEYVQERLRVARRLLTELNLTERDTAAFVGVVQSHLSNQLQHYSTETGEYEREPASKRRKQTQG